MIGEACAPSPSRQAVHMSIAPRPIVAFTCLVLGVAGSAVAGPSSLLDSDRGGHHWFRYCENQPDDTPLPADPRSLVTPTYDKAGGIHAAWPARLGPQPATRGEPRSLGASGGPL